MLPYRVWKDEESIPALLLWWKLGQVIVPILTVVVLLFLFILTRGSLSKIQLVWWSLPTLMQGYSMTFLVIYILTKTITSHHTIIVSLGFLSAIAAALPFFVCLWTIQGHHDPSLAYYVLIQSLLAEMGMGFALLGCRELERKLSATIVTWQLWELYLIPPLFLHIYSFLWVVSGLAGELFWLSAAIISLGTIINGAFFYTLGLMWHRFPGEDDHKLWARAGFIAEQVAFSVGVTVVILGAYSWLILVLAILSLAAVIRMTVRWRKTRSRYLFS